MVYAGSRNANLGGSAAIGNHYALSVTGYRLCQMLLRGSFSKIDLRGILINKFLHNCISPFNCCFYYRRFSGEQKSRFVVLYIPSGFDLPLNF